jgi:uncharacterized protein YutE (UPF0331/DUF86 family)
MPAITWGELTELIKALAALAWPIIVLILVLMFKGRVRDLLSNRRLKRGKILGQEFELEEELNRLEQNTTPYATPYATIPASPSSEPAQAEWQAEVQRQVYDVTRQVLAEAGTSPKAALMSLGAQLESELRRLLQEAEAPVGPRTTWRDSVAFLRERGLPEELLESMMRFRNIRNKIVHGYDASDNDMLRAIDVGLRILNAMRAQQRSPRGPKGK